jgi:parallel beta-helix repeat protein
MKSISNDQKKTCMKFLLWMAISLFAVTTGRAQHAGRFCNILDYGAVGDGVTLNTVAIQHAIDDCAKKGGGRVVVPAGNFVTGSLRLFSDINFCLEAGAVLTGSPDRKDYLYQKDFGFSGSGAGKKTGILFATGALNVSLTGEGTINGQGDLFVYADSLQNGKDFDAKYTRQGNDYMNPAYGRADGPVMWKGSNDERPGTLVTFSDCKNVHVTDIRFVGAPNWTMDFLNCENVKTRGITIENNMDIPNSDGIDMYDSRNVTISDCVIKAGDDAIAVVSSSDITVNNCVLHSRSSGIRIGYNVFNHHNSGNLLFNNIRIYESNRGIGIFQRQEGDMQNMVFSNMIIDTRLHSGQWWGHGEPIHISAVPGLGSKKVGKISNVRFSNITATSENGILFYGSKESVLENIELENVNLTIRRGALSDSYGGNIDLRPTNDISIGIFRRDLPAVLASNVQDLRVKDLRVQWGPHIPGYFTHALECTNFNGVSIEGLNQQGISTPEKKQPVVYLHDGKNASVRGIVSAIPGTIPLLQRNVVNITK